MIDDVLVGTLGDDANLNAADAGVNAGHVRRLGIPDHFVEHGERDELLADLGLDIDHLVALCRELSGCAAELP